MTGQVLAPAAVAAAQAAYCRAAGVTEHNRPSVRVPSYLLNELRPFARKRNISVMRLARVLLHEIIAADLVDDIAGDAR